MSVCIVKDGKVVYMKGFGEKEVGKGQKVDKNTIFLIGSNSKAFIGTSLAMLEYDSLCTLNDPVKKCVSKYHDRNAEDHQHASNNYPAKHDHFQKQKNSNL